MNILLLGAGGREHALAWKIVRSKHCTQLFIAPGNAGTAQHGENINIAATDFEAQKKFCLQHEIEMAGGHIDAIFYCADLEDSSPFRKPNPGMGLQAASQFPDIDLSKSIMVGNTTSDMEFGRNLGVYTVFLPTTRPEVDLKDPRIDAVYDSLIAFAKDLLSI